MPDGGEEHLSRQLRDLSAMNRHRMIMRHMGKQSARPSFLKTDADTLRDHHQFIRDDGGFVCDEAPWGERLAARYYSKLLKEYAVCELSGYKEGRVGLRWRTEQEVVVGKGQFECGSLACGQMQGLQSYEVPFKYMEQNQRKQALVKVRLCHQCAQKLYYKKEKQLKKLNKLLKDETAQTRSNGIHGSDSGRGTSQERKRKSGSSDDGHHHRKRSRGSKSAEPRSPRGAASSPQAREAVSAGTHDGRQGSHPQPGTDEMDSLIDDMLM